MNESNITPRTLYVAYGKGLNIREMKRHCPDAELVGTGEIDGQELRFKGIAQYSYLTLCPNKESSVPVAVWKIREEDVDKFKKVENGSSKKPFSVRLDNGYTVNAFGFYSEHEYSIAMPAKRYFQEVYQGYVDNGFDTQILHDALINTTHEFYTKTKDGWLEFSTPYEQAGNEEITENPCDENQLGIKPAMQ